MLSEKNSKIRKRLNAAPEKGYGCDGGRRKTAQARALPCRRQFGRHRAADKPQSSKGGRCPRDTPSPPRGRPGAARATHRAGGRAGAGRTGRPAAGPAGWPPRRARSGCSRRRPGCCSAPAAAASPPGRPRSPPGPAAAPVAGDGGGSVTRSAVTVTAAECPLDPRGDAPSATRKWVPLGVLGKSASPGPLRPCPR